MNKSQGACIFCQIVAYKAPSSRAYEDDKVIAFLDVNPVTEGHALIIPREHYPDLADIPEEIAGHMFVVAQHIAAAIRKSSLKSEGINLFYADGEAAFQEIFHAHLHVFPRFKGDTFKIDADWTNKPERLQLDKLAQLIKDRMQPVSPRAKSIRGKGKED